MINGIIRETIIIPENTKGVLGTLSAVDRDEDDTHSFTIESGSEYLLDKIHITGNSIEVRTLYTVQ